ncbi:MAG: GNAT family N-acetyltransferase [Acidimicrobiales bacterium]
MVGARPATAADDDAVAALRLLARRHLDEQRGGDQFARAEAADEPGDATVVVGTIGDAVVGIASVVHRGTRALLTELFTHPEARSVGVGHAMLGVVSDHARAWGCTDLDSYALPGDRDTKNFFESHAMKSRLLVVHRSLTEDPA